MAVYFQVSADFPLVVAANRDEFYDRRTAAPAGLSVEAEQLDEACQLNEMGETGESWMFGGRDLVAGGTWLGLNAGGLVAALLNRRTGKPPDPTRRSRGLLCLGALQDRDVPAAAARVCAGQAADYNPFHLLLASPASACTVGNSTGDMHMRSLDPGVHVLTNLEPNDPGCPRIAKSQHLFLEAAAHLHGATPTRFLERVREILSDHSTAVDPRAILPPDNLCVHTVGYGTRSSTVLAYSSAAGRFLMWHAEGPPCSTAYTPLVLPESAGDDRRPNRSAAAPR